MSIIGKVVAAVSPPESDEARSKARVKARSSAAKGDWLSMVLDWRVPGGRHRGDLSRSGTRLRPTA
jgi:hypothetical protein